MNQPKKFKLFQGPLLYIAMLAIILVIVQMVGQTPKMEITKLNYSELLKWVEADAKHDLGIDLNNDGKSIKSISITSNTLIGITDDTKISAENFGDLYDIICEIPSAERFYSDVNSIYATILGREVSPTEYAFTAAAVKPEGTPWWVEWLPLLVTVLLFGGMWFIIMRSQTGGGGKNGVMNFGKSHARLQDPSKNHVTFNDVAGADEEKEELKEIVEFLKNPEQFRKLGARIPKGVLLVGPPGTGKTLLARAVSGEAKVPFFTISGSDFVEMFVGVGASRVRDLFDQAKKASPAIIFIDEIDAVGRQRGAGLGGGHDEREQTLNQLLVEMDGFTHNQGVIVMAATNRSDILDPALLRPGRFDRQIVVNYPDVKGREEILKVHSKGKPLASDVDLEVLARRTPYFTGADLENVMNEGAILSARAGKTEINMATLEEAITRVAAGPEKKSRKITEKDKKLVSYHEAGHAIVSYFIPECDTVHEISIIPRGQAAGYTMYLPREEINHITSAKLKGEMASLLGGHCAEQMMLGDVSTGSTSDLKRATQIARGMVTEYGMSESLGPIFLGGEHEVFLGRDFSSSKASFSEEVNAQVDREVRGLLDSAMNRANTILNEHKDSLEMVAAVLIEKEKIDKDEFEKFMNPQAAITEQPTEEV